MITKDLLDRSLILDVRTQDEVNEGYFPGATHIPLSDIPARLAEIQAFKKPIVVYCKSGHRSGLVTQFLIKNGIEAYNGINQETLQRIHP